MDAWRTADSRVGAMVIWEMSGGYDVVGKKEGSVARTYSCTSRRVSKMVSWDGDERWVRWKAAKERPIVPVPIRVMRRSCVDSVLVSDASGCGVVLVMIGVYVSPKVMLTGSRYVRSFLLCVTWFSKSSVPVNFKNTCTT